MVLESEFFIDVQYRDSFLKILIILVTFLNDDLIELERVSFPDPIQRFLHDITEMTAGFRVQFYGYHAFLFDAGGCFSV